MKLNFHVFRSNKWLPCLEKCMRVLHQYSLKWTAKSLSIKHLFTTGLQRQMSDVCPVWFSPFLPLTVSELLTENANRLYPLVTLSTHDTTTCPEYHTDTSSGEWLQGWAEYASGTKIYWKIQLLPCFSEICIRSTVMKIACCFLAYFHSDAVYYRLQPTASVHQK